METLVLEAQTKSCIHQHPEERSCDTTKDWIRIACYCQRVSCGGMGQERLTIETGALAAVALKGPLLHNSSRRLPTVVLDAQSCPTLYDPLDWQHARLPCPWDSPGKNTGMGCHSLLQVKEQTLVSCTAGRFFTKVATRLPSTLP